jgi:hypothetical protein
MSAEHWIVTKPSGEEWGIIKRLCIDPTTKQITYADVILGETGRLVHVPWENFHVQKERITLSLPDGKLNGTVRDARRPGHAETVAMEVWP